LFEGDHSSSNETRLSSKKSSPNIMENLKDDNTQRANEIWRDFRLPKASSTQNPNMNIQTQTDWSWVNDMQLLERIRRG
jgi:hypothetical protein